MPESPPNLFSRQAHGSLGTAWIWFWNGKKWCATDWWKPPIDPNREPVYEGISAYQLELVELWTTTVVQAAWRPLAKRFSIAPFHAFQKVNMTRYHHNLPTTLVPI